MNQHTGNTQPSIDREEHRSFNGVDAKAVVPYIFDGTNLTPSTGSSPVYATKIQTSGTDTYVGEATPGSAQSSSIWRCQKIDSGGNITWADGNANFDNVATDLTALTYS